MVFGAEREELIETLTALQRASCDYDSKQDDPPGICDCKYGYELKPYGSYHGEKNGCPELRSVVALLNVMTDKEYEKLGKRLLAQAKKRYKEYERSK